MGEGAQAASYQGHGAEAGTGLAGCVGAGGVLLAVLTVTRGLQPVVRTCKGHLHGCLELLQDKQGFVCVLKVLNSVFSHCGTFEFCPCCSYVELKVSGPGQFCLVLLNLIWKTQTGMIGA